jgi:hypothetical protein
MSLPSRAAATLAAVTLVVLLGACSEPAAPVETPSGEPQGPLPPSDAGITLQQLAGVVTEADAPPEALFAVGAASTSGADLRSEQDYWASVGGTPAECADVVSSPYLVTSADAADPGRTDDATGALGTFTEQEDLFGLVQVYGRVFDEAATASGFLDAFSGIVAACPGYRFIGTDGAVTYEAADLRIAESPGGPAGTRALTYSEDVRGSDALGVEITFIQHENAMVSIYSELYPSSTITADDVDGIVTAVTGRLAAL